MTAKRALTRVRAPDERAAEQRAWAVVRSAYPAHPPARRPRHHRRLALALALAVALGAAALSPAGATVGRLISHALRVPRAAPAPLSLPAPGRVLIAGQGGTWIVSSDGSTRRLGPWSDASWSPRGLYVTVAGKDLLAAVDPRGTLMWMLSQPAVSAPRWWGPSGYRVAYLSGRDLRVVAGDRTGDHLLAAAVATVAPAWRPGRVHELAYVTRRGTLILRDSDSGQILWSARPGPGTEQVQWSTDGRELLVLSRTSVRVYSPRGALVSTLELSGATPILDGALSPDGRSIALVLGGAGNEVVIESLTARHFAQRRVLAESGLRQVLWSPDGRWLLVSWPAADQLVFVRVVGAPRIAAVSGIARQFSAGRRNAGFPRLEGWCCS